MAGFQNGFATFDQYVYTTVGASVDNLIIRGTRFAITVGTDLDAITGLDSDGVPDAIIFIINAGATNRLVLKHNSGSSSVGNKIFINNGLDLTLLPGQVVVAGLAVGVGWFVFDVPVLPGATYQATPSDPTGTTSTTGLMMGLAGSITPLRTGKVMITVSGNIAATGIGGGSGAATQIRYGTGTAPTNGAALTGTAVGSLAQIKNATLALIAPGSGNFTCNAIVSGLTIGTAYWLDQSLARITSGTATISGISISVIEI